MIQTTFRLSIICIVLLMASGCEETWNLSEPIAKPRNRVWEAAVAVVESKGYSGFEETDKEAGRFMTRWRFKPSVHSFEGKRHQVTVEIAPATPPIDPVSGQEQWVVKVMANHERNEDTVNPMSYANADWRALGQDSTEETILLGAIHFECMDDEDFGLSTETLGNAQEVERLQRIKELLEKEQEEEKELEKRSQELAEREEELKRLMGSDYPETAD